ncbi:MAG TPA: hypothetical protein VLG50_08885 [Candidatus Saccharimonadales bacterium]|nr:hypothetical protein [Candidatus Saccharimonadales bacterium]
MIKKLYKPTFIFLLAILISLPIILPYFHPGYFPTHDGEWAVVRLGDMFRSLRDHQFPVRYSGNLNFGYGYPLFNFTYPAPYYLGIILHFFKLGFVDSIKFLFAGSVVLSSITMYLFSTELWKNKTAGIISAIFYVYLPYRIVDLYARGSIGESLSFVLFPLIAICALKILDNINTKFYIVFGSISYALLILTHNIMALLFTPILFTFIAAKMFLVKNKSYINSIIFILLSYALSAFFWLPALLEKHYIALSITPIADRNIYFVQLNQLLLPNWGYGLPDGPNGFSYQIGIGHLVVLITVLILIIYSLVKRKKISKDNNFIFAFVIIGIVFVLTLLMFSFTKAIWQVIPLLHEINYPWTLLAQIGFLISLLAGFLWTQKNLFKYLAFGLCLLSIILIIPHAKPERVFDKGDGYYLTNDATTTSSDELMPLWVKQKPRINRDKKAEIIKGIGGISSLNTNSKKINFLSELKTNSIIQLNTIYYPGWNAFIDGKQIPISYSNPKGLMQINVPTGNHRIDLNFSETSERLISDIISLVGLFVVIIYLTQIFYFVKK